MATEEAIEVGVEQPKGCTDSPPQTEGELQPSHDQAAAGTLGSRFWLAAFRLLDGWFEHNRLAWGDSGEWHLQRRFATGALHLLSGILLRRCKSVIA
jgi:hypothetical protein